MIGMYQFYENWSTETFGKTSEETSFFERVIDDARPSLYRLGIDGYLPYKTS